MKDSSEFDLCLYLPAICLAIESTPAWFKNYQSSYLAALREVFCNVHVFSYSSTMYKRVLGSECVAQMMSLIFISRSIRVPAVFEDIRQDLLKPNSVRILRQCNRQSLRFRSVVQTIGDTMMYDYPTNQLVEKVRHCYYSMRDSFVEFLGKQKEIETRICFGGMRCSTKPLHRKPLILTLCSARQKGECSILSS